MSVRKFFDDIQLAQESGGRQHDAGGKPLVGRYRNGKTPAPGKEAYGAGQMQIGTARATAQKHGVAWDQNKFMNDREYNLTLADKHMGDLTAKYGGDKTLAKAAYHSGEGTVDKALKKYGRQGFAKGLGPEGRNYIGMANYNASKPGVGISDPTQFLAGLERTLAPQTMSSQDVASNASAIFGSDAELNKRAGDVEVQLGEQMNSIDVLDQATQALQAQQVTSAETMVQETRAVSDEISRGTEELKNQVKPIIEARGRIANQLDQINSMNPLERGFRGIFDLNYDRNYLESQLDHYDKTMEARAQDYDYLNKLHNVALAEVDRRFKLDTTLPGLMADQAKEDLGIVGLRVQQTAASLGNLQDLIRGQSQIISAKAGAREDIISRLDAPTLANLAAQAQANNGVVNHGGVELSYNELYERQQAKENQDLQQEQIRMNIAEGRIQFAEKQAVQLARSLTREQAEGAIANSGVFNGIQLPQDVLTEVYQSHLKRAEMQAATVANNIPAKAALRTGIDALNTTTAIYQRTRGMYGEGDRAPAASIMNAGTLAIRALVEATKTNQPPEVIAALTAKVAQTTKQMQDHTDGVILRQVGGDKRAAGYMSGFVYGTPMSQGTAVEALTYFAVKGNLPSGMQVSPEVKQIFQKTQEKVAELRKQRQDPATQKPWTEKGLAAAVNREITQIAADTVGSARFQQIWTDLPTVAKQMNHPLGRIKASDWARARLGAEDYAARQVATRLGLPLEKVVEMNRKNKALSDSQEDKDAWAKFDGASGLWNDAEQKALVDELDEMAPVTPGRRNSSVVLDFMTSGRASKFIQQYTGARSANSFGDYLVNPMAAGTTEAAFTQQAQTLHSTQQTVYGERKRLARTQGVGMLAQPVNRAMVILGSMPGVSPAGAQKLKPYIEKIAKQSIYSEFPKGVSVNAQMTGQDAEIYEGLKTMKFDDPALETIRKNAVSSWPQHSTQTKGILESMLETASSVLSFDNM